MNVTNSTAASLFSNSEIEEAKCLVSRIQRITPVVTAFFGGSIVEGWGNSTSDVDLIVVSQDDASLALLEDFTNSPVKKGDSALVSDECFIVSSLFSSRRADIEVWPIAKLMELHSRMHDAVVASSFPGVLTETELEFFRDIQIGLPVSGSHQLTELKSRFSDAILCHYLARKFEYRASGFLEDLAGSLSAGDLVASIINSRGALGAGIDSWIARSGHSNSKEKWRGQRLLSTKGNEALAEYIELEIGGGSIKEKDILNDCKQRAFAAQDYLIRT